MGLGGLFDMWYREDLVKNLVLIGWTMSSICSKWQHDDESLAKCVISL